ncbi:MAG: ATP-binding protein [Phycisphaerales bacterium]|nr:ATP-binding protein [Phycisphaerales bacterium]
MPDPECDHSEIAVEIDAKPDLLGILRDTIEFWSRRRSLTDDRAHELAMAVDEAASNIVRHAYQEKPGGRIRMRCRAARAGEGIDLTIVLEDDGTQVPLDLIKSRNLDDVRPGGLGVHLIQQATDEVTWQHRPEGGTLLTMRVHIPARTLTLENAADGH